MGFKGHEMLERVMEEFLGNSHLREVFLSVRFPFYYILNSEYGEKSSQTGAPITCIFKQSINFNA